MIDGMYDDVISEAYDSVFENFGTRVMLLNMRFIEQTFNALRMIQTHPYEIENILFETDRVFSERKMCARLHRMMDSTKERPKVVFNRLNMQGKAGGRHR